MPKMFKSNQKSQYLKDLHDFIENAIIEEKAECIQCLTKYDQECLTLLLIKTLDDPIEWLINHDDLQSIMFEALQTTDKDEIYELAQKIKDAAVNHFSDLLNEMIQIQFHSFDKKEDYNEQYHYEHIMEARL